MTTDDTRLAALLLTNSITRVDAQPLRAREFWALVDHLDTHGVELGVLLGADRPEHAELPDGLDPVRVHHLLDAMRALAFEIDRLAEGGVALISAFDENFPGLLRDRLGHRCPPRLFVAGPATWLPCDGLAIVGADDAVPAAHDVARSAVAEAVIAHAAVITDHISAMADTVTSEAIACEASLVAIAAEGINRTARTPAVRNRVHAGQVCIASAFAPEAPPTAVTTEARDSIVYALAHTTLVVAVHDGIGPTWRAALDAVQREPASVATWVGRGSLTGNAALARLGATPISTLDELHSLTQTMSEAGLRASSSVPEEDCETR
jgi:predicted Rossmann fold nucleotide-binding protein DprA/Smf involved in DNA uptake